jgi:2-iminobutanoate/2-iminopropanoate deaminase
MTERVTYSGLPVGGTEPLIASATRFGDLLFLSGRAPIDTGALEVVSDDFEAQARLVLDEIVATLREAGSSPQHVLRVECYLTDPADFDAWNRLWAEYFPAPRPARTTIVAGFVLPRMKIEVQVTAGVPGAGS